MQAGAEEGKTFRLPALAHAGPPKSQMCSNPKGWVCRVDISTVWEHQEALSALPNVPFKLNVPAWRLLLLPLSPTAPPSVIPRRLGLGGGTLQS